MCPRQTDTWPQRVCGCLPPPFMISTSSPPRCLPLKSSCKPTLRFLSKQITAPPRNMSVNVFLTRLEESGAAPRELPVLFFLCGNVTTLPARVSACSARHVQRELRRVEASVTGVRARERVAAAAAAVACMCAAAGGGGKTRTRVLRGRAGRFVIKRRRAGLRCNVPLLLLTSQFD